MDIYGFHIILDRDRSHVKGWGTLSTGEKLYLQTKEGDIGLIIGPISLFTLWSTGPYIYKENSSRLCAGVHNICKVVSRPILEVWTLGEGEQWELHM